MMHSLGTNDYKFHKNEEASMILEALSQERHSGDSGFKRNHLHLL